MHASATERARKRSFHFATLPLATNILQFFNAPRHVVQNIEQQKIARATGSTACQGARCCGLKQQLIVALALHQRIKGDAQQATTFVSGGHYFQIAFEQQKRPLTLPRQNCITRLVNFDQLAVHQQIDFGVVKICRAANGGALKARRFVDTDKSRHITFLTGKHLHSRSQRRATLPSFDHSGVTTLGHAARAKISGHINAVDVDPI